MPTATIIALRKLLPSAEQGEVVRLPPERELARQMGISRRALREALDVLEEEGAIWRRQGQGTFSGPRPQVVTLNADGIAELTNPLELIEARMEIEPALARMAAMRATPALVEQLERIAAKAEEAHDIAAWEQWDAAFHAKIASASANQLFIAIMTMFDEIRRSDAWRHFRTRVRSERRTLLSVNEHKIILDAIRRMHPADAENAMRDHLLSLKTAMNSDITASPSGD